MRLFGSGLLFLEAVKLGQRSFLSTMIVSSLTIQGIVGFGLTLLAIATVMPGLFPSFGLFIPLGFELGPGQALSIGKGWEEMGFDGAGSVGLAFAAFGFLWASFGGVFLMNWGIKKGWLSEAQAAALRSGKTRTGIYQRRESAPIGALLTTESEAIDSMSLNVGLLRRCTLLRFCC